MSSSWRDALRGDPIPWLLEADNPSVRAFTLTDLLGRPASDSEVVAARKAIMHSRPVRDILAAQYPAGYWIKPDVGYSPKYRATVWQVIFLTDLGATRTEAIARACEHVLAYAYLPEVGLFSAHKRVNGTFPCLNGNLLRALWHFGYGAHPIVQQVAETLAGKVVEEQFRCRCDIVSPGRDRLPCVWGCIKVLGGFAAIPPAFHSPIIQAAIARGVNFLLSYDLVRADYPYAEKIGELWWQFGFPLGFAADALEALTALAVHGAADDPRLIPAFERVLDKQDEQGRWLLETTLEKTWTQFEEKGRPSKWVTLRALQVLKRSWP
ncbi:MAG: nitrogen fixation protein NifH [Anaerolineae bacterium]|jgi:hypothetical protein|nr:nitrogen fixation protein NifH [Anaerolineae bacterium]MDH7474659.1 nitrogen fixation protein NifH [Anaerolineae bacterium]